MEKTQHALEIGQMETLIKSLSSEVTELKVLLQKQSKDHTQIIEKIKGQQQFIGKEVQSQSKSIQDLHGDQTRLASHLDSIGPTVTLKKPVTSSSIPYLLLFAGLFIGGVAVTQDNGILTDYFLKLKEQLS